jgi:hypothetical protein
MLVDDRFGIPAVKRIATWTHRRQTAGAVCTLPPEANMIPRDQLIGVVLDRIARAEGGNAASVLSPQALGEARRLAEFADDGDIESAFALGTFYLDRHRLLSTDEADRQAAVRHFGAVLAWLPDAIPSELRSDVARTGPVVGRDADEWNDEAMRLWGAPAASSNVDIVARAATDHTLDGAWQQMRDVLAWLWDTVAAPVMQHLGHTVPVAVGSGWPRVWWILTGPPSALPVHAAGYHDSGPGQDSVLDRVVSSYTPTLRTLRHARRPRPTASSADGALVVGVGMSALDNPLWAVAEEVAHVGGVLSNASALVGADATREAVLQTSWTPVGPLRLPRVG